MKRLLVVSFAFCLLFIFLFGPSAESVREMGIDESNLIGVQDYVQVDQKSQREFRSLAEGQTFTKPLRVTFIDNVSKMAVRTPDFKLKNATKDFWIQGQQSPSGNFVELDATDRSHFFARADGYEDKWFYIRDKVGHGAFLTDNHFRVAMSPRMKFSILVRDPDNNPVINAKVEISSDIELHAQIQFTDDLGLCFFELPILSDEVGAYFTIEHSKYGKLCGELSGKQVLESSQTIVVQFGPPFEIHCQVIGAEGTANEWSLSSQTSRYQLPVQEGRFSSSTLVLGPIQWNPGLYLELASGVETVGSSVPPPENRISSLKLNFADFAGDFSRPRDSSPALELRFNYQLDVEFQEAPPASFRPKVEFALTGSREDTKGKIVTEWHKAPILEKINNNGLVSIMGQVSFDWSPDELPNTVVVKLSEANYPPVFFKEVILSDPVVVVDLGKVCMSKGRQLEIELAPELLKPGRELAICSEIGVPNIIQRPEELYQVFRKKRELKENSLVVFDLIPELPQVLALFERGQLIASKLVTVSDLYGDESVKFGHEAYGELEIVAPENVPYGSYFEIVSYNDYLIPCIRKIFVEQVTDSKFMVPEGNYFVKLTIRTNRSSWAVTMAQKMVVRKGGHAVCDFSQKSGFGISGLVKRLTNGPSIKSGYLLANGLPFGFICDASGKFEVSWLETDMATITFFDRAGKKVPLDDFSLELDRGKWLGGGKVNCEPLENN